MSFIVKKFLKNCSQNVAELHAVFSVFAETFIVFACRKISSDKMPF